MKYTKLQIEEATKELKFYFENNKNIYTAIRHVSKSSMKREISVFTVEDGTIVNISVQTAIVLGWNITKKRDIIVYGCSMDMEFYTVYLLSRALFTPEDTTNPSFGDAGYALKHKAL